jgi:hypothetical protein
MNTLFGFNSSKINITIFSDERKNLNNQWDYICLLIIPTNKINVVLNIIKNYRNNNNYHHELKFAKLDNRGTGVKFQLAKDLLNEILNDTQKLYYFKIFGIDKISINNNRFGKGLKNYEIYANIYNRFYRTNILQLKGYFKNQNIEIDNIFHDNEGNLERHEYFNWHTVFTVEKDERISCNCDRIKFINSNHDLEPNYQNESHIIQLVDILIGAVSQCIEYHNKKNQSQIELAGLVLPYVDRILNDKPNWKSEFPYFGRFDINFFPTILPDWYNPKNFNKSIYKKRDILIKPKIEKIINRDNGIQSLF